MNWKFWNKKPADKNKPKKSKTREWVDAIIFGLLFSAYAIPSGSMEGTELTGDYLFVSKCSYGARMPFTPVSIPFTEPRIGLLMNMKSYWDGIQWPYMRIPGFTHVKKGDIVVFNKPSETGTPIDMRTTLIKRCQATAGDTLQIINAQVYIFELA
jgi:signal peptidase I